MPGGGGISRHRIPETHATHGVNGLKNSHDTSPPPPYMCVFTTTLICHDQTLRVYGADREKSIAVQFLPAVTYSVP
jgi:hypothetical protein